MKCAKQIVCEGVYKCNWALNTSCMVMYIYPDNYVLFIFHKKRIGGRHLSSKRWYH